MVGFEPSPLPCSCACSPLEGLPTGSGGCLCLAPAAAVGICRQRPYRCRADRVLRRRLVGGPAGRDGLAGLFLAGATLTKFYPAVLLPALLSALGLEAAGCFRHGRSSSPTCPSSRPARACSAFCRDMPAKRGSTPTAPAFTCSACFAFCCRSAALSARAYIVGAGAILAALGAAVFLRRRWSAPVHHRGRRAGDGIRGSRFAALPLVLRVADRLCLLLPLVRAVWLTIACLLLYLVPVVISHRARTITGWLSNRSSTGRLRRWRWPTSGVIAGSASRSS